MADCVVCAAGCSGVDVSVAAAFVLAEGTARLVAAGEADLLDRLTGRMPGLATTDPDDVEDCRQLQVQTPGAELRVALRRLARIAKAGTQDVLGTA